MAARAQAYLFIAAGAIGSLGVLLPHPERYDAAGLLAIQGASFAAAVLLLVLGARTPDWVATCGPFGATVLTSLAIVLTGTSTSAYLLFYMWVAFYAFYFLSRRQSVCLCLFAVFNYAAVVLGSRMFGYTATGIDANQDVPAFVLITGTIVVAGVFLVQLRERVGRLIEQLTDAASTDPLTGLLNRRGFQSVIDNELARAERSGHTFSLLLVRLRLLQAPQRPPRPPRRRRGAAGHRAAARGQQAPHRRGRPGRGRGVRARAPRDRPARGLHRRRAAARRFGQSFADQPVPLTMSLGVATYPIHGMTADALLRSSDEALYAAKSLGRDRTVLYSAEVRASSRSATSGAATARRTLATVLDLAEALDMRDTGTARHSQTVGRYSELMARELGLRRPVERVRLAGVLHDIGKIGVSDSILRKPGPLTRRSGEMRKHPEIGARILAGSGLDDIREWVLAHHERPDGRGYPTRAGRRGDPARGEDPRRRRLLRGDDERPRLPQGDRGARGARAAARNAGHPVRPAVVAAFLRVLDRTGAQAAPSARS